MNKNVFHINLELKSGQAIDLTIKGYNFSFYKTNNETIRVSYKQTVIGELTHDEGASYNFEYFGDDFGSYDIIYDEVTSIKQMLGVLLYHNFDVVDYDNY